MLQVLHVLLEDLRMDYKYSEATQSARFAINSMQLDNQLLTSTHPVVLAPSSSGEPAELRDEGDVSGPQPCGSM